MTRLVTEEVYQQALANAKWLIYDDYTDVCGAVGAISSYLPKKTHLTWDEYKPVAARLIRDLIDSGVRAGDLTADGIEPWPVSPAEAADRIASELLARDDWPDTNEIAWLDLDEDPGPPPVTRTAAPA